MRERSFMDMLLMLRTISVMVGAALVMPTATFGQVVIDMPPPRTVEQAEPAQADADQREAETTRGDELVSESESADDSSGDKESDDRDVRTTNEATRPDSTTRSAPVAGQQAPSDLGRLALGRYVGVRQYARPNDPQMHWSYQPRGRGIGPWGLGHHCSWYGNFHVVAPAVFVGGRGERLFR